MHPENVTQFMHSMRRPDLVVVRQPQRMAAMRGFGAAGDPSGGTGWGWGTGLGMGLFTGLAFGVLGTMFVMSFTHEEKRRY